MVTSEVHEAVKLKRNTWARYVASGILTKEANRAAHRAACKRVPKTIKVAELHYEEQLAIKSKSDPNCLHAHVRRKPRGIDSIKALKTLGSQVSAAPTEICTTMNDYFQSVFSIEPTDQLPSFKTAAPFDATSSKKISRSTTLRDACRSSTRQSPPGTTESTHACFETAHI